MSQPGIVTPRADAERGAVGERRGGDDGTPLRVPLAMTFDELLREADEGADDETADEIIRAVRAWRDTPSRRGADG